MRHERRTFMRKGLLAGLLGGFAAWGAAYAQTKPVLPGKFVHMVFFWLKPTTDIAAFKASTADLMEGIAEVVSYHIGEPAGTPREVVDNSYSVCLIATFNSKEDQDKYQVDATHKAYVEKNSDKWTKVQIYDSWGGN